MRKTLIVAQSEFTTLVKTKAFLVSLILMPKRLRPERGAKPPSESERGWGPASRKKCG
jgi:hypothetical protein